MLYIVSTNLNAYLNEDWGNLKNLQDIPKEWKNKIAKPGYGFAGKDSPVISINWEDQKIFSKLMKNERSVAIVKVDGKSKYFIQKISPQKFNIFDADQEYSIRRPREEAEKKKRDEEWNAKYGKKNESINERRGTQYHDPALMGEYNIGGVIDFIKRKQAEGAAGHKIEVFNIGKDPVREKKYGERSKTRQIEDPLKRSDNEYHKEASRSQKKRFAIYSEKKRAQIDKQIDSEIFKLKKQVIDNFDKALDDVVENLRKGYDQYADPVKIGEAIMKGIDTKGIKRFAAAYDTVRASYGGDNDITKAAKKLKDLGFIKKVQESLDEDFAPEHADQVTQLLWEIVEKLIDVYGYEELEAKYLLLTASGVLERLIKLNKSADFIAGFLAQDAPLNKEMKKYMEKQEKAESDYSEMVKRNSPKDYSKMDKSEIQKEIDQALDSNDYETLKKLKDYIPESLRPEIEKLLNEVLGMKQGVGLLDSAESDEPVEDEWYEGVISSLIDEFEMDEDEADSFIDIVHEELEAAKEDGLMPEEAAALVYTNEEALEKLAQLDPAYVKDFPSEEPPIPHKINMQRDPNIY